VIEARIWGCEFLESFEEAGVAEILHDLFPGGIIGSLSIVGDALSVEALVNAGGNPAGHAANAANRFLQRSDQNVITQINVFEVDPKNQDAVVDLRMTAMGSPLRASGGGCNRFNHLVE
jgi:hypothetical protein